MNLGVDESEDGREIGRPDEGPVGPHEILERTGRRAGARAKLPLTGFDLGHHRLAHDLSEELFLVREVEVDRAFGKSGALGDVVEACRREPTLAEHAEGSGEDLLGALLGESPPAGFLTDSL